MSKLEKYSLRDLKAQFPNDEACLDYMFDSLHSRKCSCGGNYVQLSGRRQFQCSKCRFQIAPQVGTIFEKSTTPLTLWFHAIWIFSNAKSGISAKEMERQLGVTYKTAWRILKLIRESLKQTNYKLRGDVEIDETYFGGRHSGGQNNKNLGEAMAAKSVIAGAVQRDGRIKAVVANNAKAKTLGKFLDTTVHVVGTRLLTDESNRYDRIARIYNRQSVNHSKKEYARGDVHVNTLESFWGHFKKSVSGTHKAISRKYLQNYLDGFVWHRNNRHNDRERFGVLVGTLLR